VLCSTSLALHLSKQENSDPREKRGGNEDYEERDDQTYSCSLRVGMISSVSLQGNHTPPTVVYRCRLRAFHAWMRSNTRQMDCTEDISNDENGASTDDGGLLTE
jgi:hypothetical protein